jgi:hypothetical protein
MPQAPTHPTHPHAIRSWREGEAGSYSVIPYPERLVPYVKAEFARMKSKQAELLGFATSGAGAAGAAGAAGGGGNGGAPRSKL